ncbi:MULTISPECIES: uroporphyrinogen decarboxylase/cobalamine-independent methonine synthase family protein [Vibrio]|uniref:5-methyltetrahydropteroyltriglutamate--homocysteine methyltransferase n=2 Tax=Vibrio TaxID=662 RepID=A0A7X4RT11_9VIBR|nr:MULTISPECIES: 5-methyltetrahydropteroyltriglutamate--homocysteine methyltransferase [Vibrio]MBF8999321.1 5-methyltetrahydropteroyltriglutamate--homocysteine methyltransferase [Vibrio nitrifigilis]MZI91732.1 5-methyltetrahydropteroyltriglutamate--homocysteine methyltransferase [Vibrio eleionomae]
MPQSQLKAPFHADVVGSYLRPQYLHDARRQFENGDIDAAQLKAIEDKAITELVEKQKSLGLKVITDGEFRRSYWHLDFMWGLNGVEHHELNKGYQFVNMVTRADSARLTGKLSGENHPFIEHFKFLADLADENVLPRLTVPAPAQFLAELQRSENQETTKAVYADENELIEDIAKAYQTFFKELAAAGCTNVQIDDCTWGMLVDPKFAAKGAADTPLSEASACGCGASHELSHETRVADAAEAYLTVNNKAIENAPEGLTVTTHVCRGNYRSHWAASGGYAPVAKVLFGRENVDAYYLEFDTDRAGDFSPLAEVTGDKKVVLGLVSSKIPELEDAATIVARIKEASQYVPLERLYLSTQCGFASTEEGNALTEEEQWAKIKLVQEVAKQVWE